MSPSPAASPLPLPSAGFTGPSEASSTAGLPLGALARSEGRRSPVGARRGFTLLEAMAVVTIVGLLSAAALPSFVERMRERRSSQAAEEIAMMYRMARSRALGRGAAQMVSIAANGSGGMNVTFEVREAIQPNDPTKTVGTCGPLPVSSCFTNWDAASVTDNRLVDTFPKEGALYTSIVAKLVPPTAGGSAEKGQVCFTPSGRTFFRGEAGSPWTPLIEVPSITVQRKDTAGAFVGLTRTVLLPPSGAARLAL